jgi:hypothetical protein
MVDVTVGTRILVISSVTNKEVGRFTVVAPARKLNGKWEVKVTLTSAPGSEPLDIIACYLGLVQADCEHSRLNPRTAFFDPTP